MSAEDGIDSQEGALTFARITELALSPVRGVFDVAHLKEIHRRIFQDLPLHAPGQFRYSAPAHIKRRQLEASGHHYEVYYAPGSRVEPGLTEALADLSGAQKLRGLNTESFCARMAALYGDLDYLHPFKEGNSRTLRVFTTQLAVQAGYVLDWNTANASAVERDRLYIARDKEVAKRFLAHADSEAQLKAYARIAGLFGAADTLQQFIGGTTRPL